MNSLGVVACGHQLTANIAAEVLREGGNAFDAVVAAQFAACVAEPVLTSLGGGGYLLAHTADGQDLVYDFFAQTPRVKRHASDLDFYPIIADFGTAQQEFHIGLGSIATPGTVRGMFAVHHDLCSMPMSVLTEQAIALAREGVTLNALQAYIFDIVHPIYLATPAAREIYASPEDDERILQQGESIIQLQLADTFDALAHESERLFYEGEVAQLIINMCTKGGGHLTAEDLSAYEVIKRKPLAVSHHGARVLTNPPPSSGGILIAFALKLLDGVAIKPYDFGSADYLRLIAEVMELTNKARVDAQLDRPQHLASEHLLFPDYLAKYQETIYQRAQCLRGTTHINVMDAKGNIASMSVSNGEGCGHMLTNTGIMLNNMLGEEDLNPQGFQRWSENQRMTSMMAPSVVILPNGGVIALGSGGSNRLRTAILQVLLNLIDFDMSLDEAVHMPRIYKDGELLSIEDGFDSNVIEQLIKDFPENEIWGTRSLFFGGVHSVMQHDKTFSGSGDPRRGGVALIVN